MSTPKLHWSFQGPSFVLFTYRFLFNTLFSISLPISHPHKKLLEKGHLFLSKRVCRTYTFAFSSPVFNSHKWRCYMYPILFLLYSCPTRVLGLFMLLDQSLLIATQRWARVSLPTHTGMTPKLGPTPGHHRKGRHQWTSSTYSIVKLSLTYSGSQGQVMRAWQFAKFALHNRIQDPGNVI